MRTALTAVLLCLLAACGAAQPPPPAPQGVTLLTLAPRPAAITASYPGTAEAVQQVEIRPRVGGLLDHRVAAEGQRVRKGDVLFQLDEAPLRDASAQAQAALAQARAGAAQAQAEFTRGQALARKDALSQQELDAALARNTSAGAAVRAAEAAANLAGLNLSYARVTSPIDGVMGRALLKDGALLTAYTSLLTTVYSTDPMNVNIALAEAELRALEASLGHAVAAGATLPAALVLADGSTLDAPGALDFVAPAVDPATGTLGLRLRFANADGRLRAGQFVRVVLTTRTVADALLVPQRALQDLQGKKFVWIADAQGKAQQRDVVPGAQVGADVLIEKGLAAGERVIVDGFSRLKPDAPVQPATPAAGGARP